MTEQNITLNSFANFNSNANSNSGTEKLDSFANGNFNFGFNPNSSNDGFGKEDFTAEDFDESIDHILGGSYHELTFVMRDGREIIKKWKNQKGAEKCQEK